jgi:hypothetical protein
MYICCLTINFLLRGFYYWGGNSSYRPHNIINAADMVAKNEWSKL